MNPFICWYCGYDFKWPTYHKHDYMNQTPVCPNCGDSHIIKQDITPKDIFGYNYVEPHKRGK